MVDKTEAIYRKDRMRGTTWVEATRTLFNMGSELEQQVDGIDFDGVKEEITALETRITNEVSAREQADTQLSSSLNAETTARENADNDLRDSVSSLESISTSLGSSVADLQTKVAENTGNITAVTGRVDVTESEIDDLNTSINDAVSEITNINADVEGIKSSLVSDVVTKSGSTSGTVIVELELEDGTKITAQDFNYGKPTSIELLQGSAEGLMKAQFTLSDGTVVYSNDFQVLSASTGDTYITSFTFKNGSSTGKISALIGLSDGRTLDANDFQLPTDPQVTANISDLLSRMTSVEQVNSTQNTNITALDTRLTTVEGKITTNENEIASLKSADQTINGEIDSLDQRVTNIENTPGIGVFQNGIAGTIVGSTETGKISANADGTGTYNMPVGGTVIGGVKNGGNVVISSDGTMNVTDTGGTTRTLTEITTADDLINEVSSMKVGDSLIAYSLVYNPVDVDTVFHMNATLEVIAGDLKTFGVNAYILVNATSVLHVLYMEINTSTTNIQVFYDTNGTVGSTNFKASELLLSSVYSIKYT